MKGTPKRRCRKATILLDKVRQKLPFSYLFEPLAWFFQEDSDGLKNRLFAQHFQKLKTFTVGKWGTLYERTLSSVNY